MILNVMLDNTMNGQSKIFSQLTDAIQAQAIASETYVNLKLKELGIGFIFNNEGQTLYIIEDYPNRPTHDFFNDNPLVRPIGYTGRSKGTHKLFYGLNTPLFITPPTSDVPDITLQLKALEDYSIKYKAENNLEVALNLLTPYFFVFKDDFQSINICVKEKLHPKMVAELLALGFNLQEIIESKSIPPQFLLKMGEANKPPVKN